MARRKRGERTLGPYFGDGRWLVVVVDAEGGRTNRYFATEKEAVKVTALVNKDIEDSVSRTMSEAITDYEGHLKAKGNQPRSVEQTVWRLERFFAGFDLPLRSLDADQAATLYEKLVGSRTRFGKPFAADTHRNVLAETRSFLGWCVGKKWITGNPLDGVKGTGRRRKGKAQLRIDEARRWDTEARKLAEQGKPGAIAAMLTLYLDLRASEIVRRTVRDLDDDGRLLWIPESKTDAGRRTLEIPETIRPYLARLAEGRPGDAPLFGHHLRDWVRKWVQRICQRAGLPSVTAHGMRGLHASLAVEAGMSSHLVAAAMGHESDRMTLGGSYATRESVSRARQRKVFTVLDGGR